MRTETERLAFEERYQKLVDDAKHIREHLRHCEYSDQRAVDGFDEILKALGIHDRVVAKDGITQPAAEMAATTGD